MCRGQCCAVPSHHHPGGMCQACGFRVPEVPAPSTRTEAEQVSVSVRFALRFLLSRVSSGSAGLASHEHAPPTDLPSLSIYIHKSRHPSPLLQPPHSRSSLSLSPLALLVAAAAHTPTTCSPSRTGNQSRRGPCFEKKPEGATIFVCQGCCVYHLRHCTDAVTRSCVPCPDMDRVVRAAMEYCVHNDRGCKAQVAYHKLADHLRSCDFVPCKCPSGDCTFRASPAALPPHFAEHHRWCVDNFVYGQPWPEHGGPDGRRRRLRVRDVRV